MLTVPPRLVGRFEEHRTPNGEVVYKEVREDAHHYFGEIKPSNSSEGGFARVESSRLTGASTAAKFLNGDPTRLMHWAAQRDQDGIARIATADMDAGRPLDWLRSREGIAARLAEAEATWTHERDRRAEQGTNVHHHTVWKLATEEDPSLGDLAEAERGFGQGVFASFLQLEPRVRYAEQLTVDHSSRTAGTFDLLAEVDLDRFPGGVPFDFVGRDSITVLLDYKTRESVEKVRKGDHVQLKIYERCNVACGIGPSDAQGVVIVDVTGDWQIHWCEATEGDAAAAINACHAGKGIDRRMGKAARAARKAREAVVA